MAAFTTQTNLNVPNTFSNQPPIMPTESPLGAGVVNDDVYSGMANMAAADMSAYAEREKARQHNAELAKQRDLTLQALNQVASNRQQQQQAQMQQANMMMGLVNPLLGGLFS